MIARLARGRENGHDCGRHESVSGCDDDQTFLELVRLLVLLFGVLASSITMGRAVRRCELEQSKVSLAEDR